MRFSIEIERSRESFTYCMKKVNDEINDSWDWRVTVNAGGIDYGIYFNFDLERKELEISNQPGYDCDDSLGLDEIIDEINEYEEEE